MCICWWDATRDDKGIIIQSQKILLTYGCFALLVLIQTHFSHFKVLQSGSRRLNSWWWTCVCFLFWIVQPSNRSLIPLQDSLGGGFDSSQALVGEMSQVGLWDRVLSPTQVASLARCGKVTQGVVAAWTEGGVEVHGGATKDPGEPCSKHSRSSQWLLGEGFDQRFYLSSIENW